MSETAKPAPDQPRVAIAEIVGLITRALVSVGVPPEDASQVAALMAESDAGPVRHWSTAITPWGIWS